MTIAAVCADPDGNVPDDRRVQVILEPVGKILASLRKARWDDENANAEPFEPGRLLEIVQSFGCLPIYGWDFFDCKDEQAAGWENRLSMRYESGDDGYGHTIDLFQSGNDRILDIRIWFDEISFFTPAHEEISIGDFMAAGQRGWDAVMGGNQSAQNKLHIFPADDYTFRRSD